MQKYQYSRSRQAILRLKGLYFRMLINAYYSFYGPLQIWTKALEYVASDEFLESDTPAEVAISYIKHYGYKDFSDKRIYPHKPLLLTQLFLIFDEFRLEQITKHFPAEYRIRSKDRTHRMHYEEERGFYRLAHRVAKQGSDLKKHKYDEYKCIANKYGWPIVANSDDAEY